MLVGLVCSVVEANNTLKHSQKLKIVIHEKCRRSLEGLKLCLLMVWFCGHSNDVSTNFWNMKEDKGRDRSSLDTHSNHGHHLQV